MAESTPCGEARAGGIMTALDIIQRSGEFVVSSETVAEGSGVEHRAVLQLIHNNIADFEDFGLVAFEMRARFAGQHGGGDVRIALLNEQQATLLMTYQRNTEQVRRFKMALVKAFFEIARQVVPALPQSYAEALRELADTAEQNAALEAKVQADAPKVEYIDTFVASEDLRLMRNVAKSLGMSESELRDALLSHHWIYKEEIERWSNTQGRKVPVKRYSPVADKRAYFRPVPVHDAPRFKGEVMHTLKVTPQGASAIARAAQAWGIVEGKAA